ncbi:hypothetical protein EXIGLDRAFT_729602 [Exidia glandulosa HHB12029]|uniref:Uncharacterized protein n=1 Tax=Exidia glandulosa HHB12029 TaxID=1314781 RepID=A0A165CHS3_EXIGL|nr:hypothetical protein EXIGLDRAFT_729602 [Exidia glandulosa HHB12029]
MVVDLDVERGKPFLYKPEQTGVLVPQVCLAFPLHRASCDSSNASYNSARPTIVVASASPIGLPSTV